MAALIVMGSVMVGLTTPPASVAMASTPSPFRVGLTHGQESADPWKSAPAVERAVGVARSATSLGNQHLMGWGALNPEPSPGVYDWSSLDQRMQLIGRTSTTPVITLCCSPDWMKGGAAGTTDWSRIETAPTMDHFDDFARLAGATARRYPHVRYFQVWNELKGFWDPARNRWDIERYTVLYNKVYRALKAVNPAIRVGGPYVPMDSWSKASVMSHPSTLSGAWGVADQRSLDAISYWLRHAVGADFITVDGGSGTKDRGVITDEFTANQKFYAMTAWIRSRTRLPIWWAEVYPQVRTPLSSGATYRADVVMDALKKIRSAGGNVALIWQPEQMSGFDEAALWTSTRTADGGRSLPLATALARAKPRWSR